VAGAGRRSRALLVYVEPTPYVAGLVERRTAGWPGGADVVFLAENVSQRWDVPMKERGWEILPPATSPAARRLRQRIFGGRYGIVHLAGWGHPLLLLAMLAARLRGIALAVETDTTLPSEQPRWKGAAKALLYPALLALPSVFLPGGTRQKRYLQRYGVPDRRIVIAQMTVDVAAIAAHVAGIDARERQEIRAAMGLPGDACVFLYVGRLEAVKGLAVLLQAYSSAAAASDSVRLLVVGDGTLRDSVKSAAAGVPGMRWLGRLDGTALLNAYAAADVLVLPSTFEPWGLVVNEAMAAGLPVIVSENVGCVDDLVADGVTGYVVEAGSASGLAAAMNGIAGDRPLRQAMRQAARERIAPWTLAAEAEIVMRAWRGVLAP
jgi:glycosyltransferase involved in cell wall biosynthesis